MQRRTPSSLVQPPGFLPQPPPNNSTGSSRASSWLSWGCPQGQLWQWDRRTLPVLLPLGIVTAVAPGNGLVTWG